MKHIQIIIISLLLTACGKALDAVPQSNSDDPVFTSEMQLKISASDPSFGGGSGQAGLVAIPRSLWVFDGDVTGSTIALTVHDTKYCYSESGGELVLDYAVAWSSSCALGVQFEADSYVSVEIGDPIELSIESGSITGRVFTWLRFFE